MSNAILNINCPMPAKLPDEKRNSYAQTLIGVLIALAVFSILANAIVTLVSSSYALVALNRARITARHLAQEKIEFIRNLPYDNVGTIGGIPSGPLPQTENVTNNGLTFLVTTSVIYIDDPFDDQLPDDLLSTDYKRVRVEVSWEGLAASRSNPITLITDISPKGLESTEGGGALSILIFDANGEPISQATVTIVAPSTDPPVSLTLKTGDNGRIILPGAPICLSCYQIAVSKEGYSSDKTYSTTEITNPNKPHQTILEGQLTEISFAIDKVSTLAISSVKGREDNFAPLANISFHMRGDKTLGTDADAQPIYKYDESLSTDSGGQLPISNLEWDNYSITFPEGFGYDMSGTNPLLPLTILPDSTTDFSLALSPHTASSLWITFLDASQARVASVSATLSDEFGFEQTKFSGGEADPDFGQVFFASLSEQSYHLTATASGFIDFENDFAVSGTAQGLVILTRQ